MRWPFPLLFQQEIRFHISLPKKPGKDRICIPVTAFSVVSKTCPSHIQNSTALGNPHTQTEKHNLSINVFHNINETS